MSACTCLNCRYARAWSRTAPWWRWSIALLSVGYERPEWGAQ